MKKVIVAVPHSHTWLWTQTCISALQRNPPKADGCEAEIVVVDNSWDWSPAIKGISETRLGEGLTVWNNRKSNKFHASALDDIIDNFEFDYLMALETDVLALHPDWLQWFVDRLGDRHFAVGHWHHEQFINPSCTLYRGDVLREMNRWCKANKSDLCRWGETFEKTHPLDFPEYVSWVAGPFSEKRGFPEGHQCREQPSGQIKGPGWYEPGQQLYHWAEDEGYTFCICPVKHFEPDGCPDHTLYGPSQEGLEERIFEVSELWGRGYAAHLWAGTRSLDIIKHPVEDQFTKENSARWIGREARFWLEIVPPDVQKETVGLIERHGWHTKTLRLGPVEARDRQAARWVQSIYRSEGIPFLHDPFIGDMFDRHGSDKNTNHRYGEFYQSLFPDRLAVRTVLEIGVAHGGGLKAFAEFYPNATIVGFDNQPSPCSGERIEIHQGEMGRQEELMRAVGDRQFDLIVEDASHVRDDNLRTIFWLWPSLKPGGIYVTEEWYNVRVDQACFGVFSNCEVVACPPPFADYEEELLVVIRKPK